MAPRAAAANHAALAAREASVQDGVMPSANRTIRTPVFDIAYGEGGPPDGPPVILLHGFPYAPRGYDAVVAILAAAGRRCLVPYLRGYGPTRFLDPATPRSGQQAALGRDLLDFMDALAIPRAVLCGYDWGGRAAVAWARALASNPAFDPEARRFIAVAEAIDRIYAASSLAPPQDKGGSPPA